MGSCCAVGRTPRQPEYPVPGDGYNSVLFHPDASYSNIRYNLVYRPPNLNDRLMPGESKPNFWLNPMVPSQCPAIVSIAWARPPSAAGTDGQPHGARNRNSKRPSKNHYIKSTKLKEDTDMTISELCHEKALLDSGDNNLMVRSYPDFLMPFVNQTIRLRLVCMDSKVWQLVGALCHLKPGVRTDPSAELSYLIRNMHSLRLHMTYSRAVSGLPEVSVEENHGGLIRLKKIRYRPMPVSWVDMDHRKPSIKIVGDSFLLSLEPPPPNLRADDFPDSNGELPSAVGIYVRNLDNNPDTQIHFSTGLFSWYSLTNPITTSTSIRSSSPSSTNEDQHHLEQASTNEAHCSLPHEE